MNNLFELLADLSDHTDHMMEQREITFDLETIMQGECICMVVPYFSEE